MQLIDGKPVFSATDPVGYLACEHLTALERGALDGIHGRPERHDRELDLIRRHGERHEERYLAELEGEGHNVVRIEKADGEERRAQVERQATETVAAMQAGADVVYQATFFDGRWIGYADFLLRRESPERPSVWGPYHYEVADTKLARHVKASAVLQICSYVDQLTRHQGVKPERLWVVLGGSAREKVELRVDDYMAYYRAAKRRFEEAFDLPTGETYPEPVDHCDVCRWWQGCADRRRADDHLSLVAGITSSQRRALVQRDITTVSALADMPLAFDPPLDGSSAASLARVREQARIQVEGRAVAPSVLYELLEPIEPERGLGTLPRPDSGDLFLDLEGDPYAFDDGLDYLFGVLDQDLSFQAIWSHDPDGSGEFSLAGEKAAFERLMDLLTERLERFPGMHVYHYAAYEPTALKRLMGRHATREEAVDRLLRGGVLVDLFRAVRQGLRASVESYSIKRIEPLYGFVRAVPLKDATSSIVAFEEWLQLADTDRPSSQILDEIAAYNRDDVVSTYHLRNWLEDRRTELATRTGVEVPRPVPQSQDPTASVSEAAARVEAVADRLTDGAAVDPKERSAPEQASWLLAQLLSWHRRELKATYWEFFHRIGLGTDDLVADPASLGRLEVIGPEGDPWRRGKTGKWRQDWRYRMPAQEHDLNARSELFDPALQQEHPDDMKAWRLGAEVREIDDRSESVVLAWPADAEPRHPEAIVPLNVIGDKDHRASLLRLGEWVADNGAESPDAPWRAARDLLLRMPPRCGQPTELPLHHDPETDLEAACRLALSLDHGTLAIQGPPGSGKTYTGARMIVRLLQGGKHVGISATSHRVISNFLIEVLKAADEAGGIDVRAAQKVSDDSVGVNDDRVTLTGDNAWVRSGLAEGRLNLVAGTSWLWASHLSDGLLDVLFVDEAGQISLANVLAMGASTTSIVLLGDPQQLDQPLKGSHPPGADRSSLAHLLGDHDTMPPDLGLFLEDTWRLHPDVTRFTSTAFYEGRLESRPDLARQALIGPAPLRGTGLRMVASDHAGADNSSAEEARQVAELVRALVESGAAWRTKDGDERDVGWTDVLVVAPYNAQVGEIQRLLPPEAKVGTVDKFQGQEAAVSIYSMTTSSPEDAPRGMNFLYSRNRLNVATSRARCVAIVVAEPALLRVRARTPEQMRLANALCQFAELAAQSP